MKLRMKLYPAQLKAWNSDKKIVAFIGGIGCGKTYLGKAVEALREVMKGEDTGKIKEKMEELKRVSQEIGRILYASSQQQETSGSERK